MLSLCFTLLVSYSKIFRFFAFKCVFFLEGCGHCKRAKPQFNKAADYFKDDPRIGLAAVDCTKHNAVCSVYSVKGFPTIKYFSYLKTVREYNGGRTVSNPETKHLIQAVDCSFIQFLSN